MFDYTRCVLIQRNLGKNMKKIILSVAIVGTALLTGCAQAPYQNGFIFSNTAAPVYVTDANVGCDKKGSSSSSNILGLFAMGDASTAAAKANGSIQTVGTVDVQFNSILGIISHTKTTVCGK